MAVQWDDRLLKASLNRTRTWAGENPIKYSLVFGLPAFAIQAAITTGIFQMGNVVATGLSLVIVPIVLVATMLVRTLLFMLYEVREALGTHLDPAVSGGDPGNFSCDVVDSNSREVFIRVTNHENEGDFHAKIVDLRGVERAPVPITVRWRGDEGATSRRIGRGDSELLAVARVRGRRAVDFLEPRTAADDAYQRVAARGNGGPVRHEVGAVLQVFNRRIDAEGTRVHLLQLRFRDDAEAPTSALVSLTEEAESQVGR